MISYVYVFVEIITLLLQPLAFPTEKFGLFSMLFIMELIYFVCKSSRKKIPSVRLINISLSLIT